MKPKTSSPPPHGPARARFPATDHWTCLLEFCPTFYIPGTLLIIVALGLTINFASAETGSATATYSKLPGYLEFPGAPDGHGGARSSNFDWNQLTQTTNILPPNALVADYFVTPGAPIQSVRWWGAYPGGSLPGSEDGFVISFFGSDDSFRPGRLLNEAAARRGREMV